MFKSITLFFRRLFSPKPTPFVYVAIGDSTVEGIGSSHPSRSYASLIFSMIKQKNKRALHYNLGKNGATSKDVLETQIEPTIAYQPDLITLSVGANDIRLRVGLREFETNLKQIMHQLKNETSAKIIINNIPNFSASPRVPRHLRHLSKLQIQRFNRVIAKQAKFFAVTHVDLYTQTSLYAKTFPEIIATDQFHPSDFGYALWANTIISAMQDIIPARKEFKR